MLVVILWSVCANNCDHYYRVGLFYWALYTADWFESRNCYLDQQIDNIYQTTTKSQLHCTYTVTYPIISAAVAIHRIHPLH